MTKLLDKFRQMNINEFATKMFRTPETYLEPSGTSMMGLFCENSLRLLEVNYFCK